jgi:hypothetical protein
MTTEDILEDILAFLGQEYVFEKHPFFADRNLLSDWVVSKCGRSFTMLKKTGISMPKVESHLGINMITNRSLKAKESLEKSNVQECRIRERLQEFGVMNLQWDCRISPETARRVDFLFYLPSLHQWWGIDCFDHTGTAAIRAEVKRKVGRGYHKYVNNLFLVIPDGVESPKMDNLPSNIRLVSESQLYDWVLRYTVTKT